MRGEMQSSSGHGGVRRVVYKRLHASSTWLKSSVSRKPIFANMRALAACLHSSIGYAYSVILVANLVNYCEN